MIELNFESDEKLLSKKLKKLKLSSERFTYSSMSENAEREIKEAKLKDRSYLNLNEWGKLNYYKDNWCQKMFEIFSKAENQLDYINYEETTVEDFRNKYEKLNIPVIIKGNTKDWKAQSLWAFDVKYLFKLNFRICTDDLKKLKLKSGKTMKDIN
jgi:hypothetical protein